MKYFISTAEQLSHTLRDVRKTRGLSQSAVGKLVGLLPKTISSLENRPESATIESFLKLLSALDLELVLSPKKKSVDSSSSIKTEEW